MQNIIINDSIIITRHLVVSIHLRYVFIFVAVLLKEKELYQIGASYLLNRKRVEGKGDIMRGR